MAFQDQEFWDLINSILFKMMEQNNRCFITSHNNKETHETADAILDVILHEANDLQVKLGIDPRPLAFDTNQGTLSFKKQTNFERMQKEHHEDLRVSHR